MNASNEKEILTVPIPDNMDMILDDGSHRFQDQRATLELLWEKLAPGGYYIIEDILVGSLPWDTSHKFAVPSSNQNCGNECFFPQKPSEHPFMYDRFGTLQKESRLGPIVEDIMNRNDWFWTITGVHKGGA